MQLLPVRTAAHVPQPGLPPGPLHPLVAGVDRAERLSAPPPPGAGPPAPRPPAGREENARGRPGLRQAEAAGQGRRGQAGHGSQEAGARAGTAALVEHQLRAAHAFQASQVPREAEAFDVSVCASVKALPLSQAGSPLSHGPVTGIYI